MPNKPQTRPEQLADAYVAVARVNHYMVGIVDLNITDNERDEAEQLLISRQNALTDAVLSTDTGRYFNRRLSLALNLLENDRLQARHRDVGVVTTLTR